MKPRYWTSLLLTLLVVWGVALGVRAWVNSRKPTSDSLKRMVDGFNYSASTSSQRRAFIDGLSDKLNRLPFDERQKFRATRAPDRLFKVMDAQDRLYFVDKTFPAGMKQMIEAINKMPRDQRQRMVNQALDQMKKNPDQDADQRASDMQGEAGKKIVEVGLETYLSESSAETKIDLAPLVDAIQQQLQSLR